MYNKKYKKGFTLLEILLVVVFIGILAGIVLIAMNPNRQIARVQDRVRQSDMSKLQKAIDQYKIDNKGKTPALTGVSSGQYKDICPQGGGAGCVDLSFLVPGYLSSIPKDPTGVNYKIGLNPDNNKLSLWSSASTQTELAINKFIPLAAAAKDPTFFSGGVSGFNDSVMYSVIQSDGKIIVGGYFTTYQGVTANRIIRLNVDGSIDYSFNIGSGFNNYVRVLAIQSDGRIVVGGYFTSYQGLSANRIIRLNGDGSVDNSFNVGVGFDSTIFELKIQDDGKLLLGGSFTTYQNVSANRMIRLNNNGGIDNSFNSGTGFNSTVRSITVQNDSKILVGGDFSSYQGVGSNYIIRLNSDGSKDNNFNIGTGFTGVSPFVSNIVQQVDGKILVSGGFTSWQNQGVNSANRIIRLNSDGSKDNSFNIGTGFNNGVNNITLQGDGKILVGGSFTTYQDQAINRIIRLNSDGSIDSSFDIGLGFNSTVNDITQQIDGKLIVGGVFSSYKNNPAAYLIRLVNY